jgi:hypothetical protein
MAMTPGGASVLTGRKTERFGIEKKFERAGR